jgi:hypothetical protein
MRPEVFSIVITNFTLKNVCTVLDRSIKTVKINPQEQIRICSGETD